jgi:hypothetical protein
MLAVLKGLRTLAFLLAAAPTDPLRSLDTAGVEVVPSEAEGIEAGPVVIGFVAGALDWTGFESVEGMMRDEDAVGVVGVEGIENEEKGG